VRNAFDLQGVSYARKIREAVMAVKINQKYTKDEIMGFYLNTVYFGRGSYGIEAAAESYFGKHASQLTPEEGMVLAAVIKSPEGPDGFDPAQNPKNAQDRWANYVRPNMVKLHFLDGAKAAAMTYPTNILKPDATSSSAAQYGKDTPTGFVVHHVMDELSHQTDVKLGNLKTTGYKIYTTIDKTYEDAAIKIADPTVKGSVMSTQPPRLQAALVAIEPDTGKVLAYYGGHDGSGLDNAGIYSDPVLEDGTPSGNHFSPGSTMKVYTMTTALSQKISIDSYWQGPPSMVFPGRGDGKKGSGPPVTQSEGDSCPPPSRICTMQYALQVSTNVVFYGVGLKVGPDKVIDTAHAMGVNHIWGNKLDPATGLPTGEYQRYDLDKYKGKDLFPHIISPEVAIGQYGITVQDNAAGVATLAAGGVHFATHFVDYVEKGSKIVYHARTSRTLMSDAIGLTSEQVDDATWAMSTVIDNGLAKNKLAGGRRAASKTGTWQLCDASTCKSMCQAASCKGRDHSAENRDAWYSGFTPHQLATVVHIGSKDPKDQSVSYFEGKTEKNMNGANTPGDIWKKFMDTVLAGKPKNPLRSPKHVGRVDGGNAASPQPSAPPDPGNGKNGGGNQCPVPIDPCPTTPPNGGGPPSRRAG
jgi:membrane peptidoglycan carboxypeptidase